MTLFEEIRWRRYIESPPFNAALENTELKAKYWLTLNFVSLPFQLIESFKKSNDICLLFLLEEGLHYFISPSEGMIELRKEEFLLNQKFFQSLADKATDKDSFVATIESLLPREAELDKKCDVVESITEPLTLLCIQQILKSKIVRIDKKVSDAFIDVSSKRFTSSQRKLYEFLKESIASFDEAYFYLLKSLFILDFQKVPNLLSISNDSVKIFQTLMKIEFPKIVRPSMYFLIRYNTNLLKLYLRNFQKYANYIVRSLEKPIDDPKNVLLLEKLVDTTYRIKESMVDIGLKLVPKFWKKDEFSSPAELIAEEFNGKPLYMQIPIILESEDRIYLFKPYYLPNQLFKAWFRDLSVCLIRWCTETSVQANTFDFICPFKGKYCQDCTGTEDNCCFVSRILTRILDLLELR